MKKTKKAISKYKITMLVDDNEIDNFINQKMLEGTSFAEKVFVYTSGRSALEFLKNFEKNEDLIDALAPDFLFLDINMPMMDGFQFLDEITRFGKKLNGKMKIAILTTSFSPIDREKALLYKKVVRFISKPLTEEALKEL
jgi:CheY-like chemotaxis protein